MIQHCKTGIDYLYLINILHSFKKVRQVRFKKTINDNIQPLKTDNKSVKKVNFIRLVRDLYLLYDS
jgi:hypothetical protein